MIQSSELQFNPCIIIIIQQEFSINLLYNTYTDMHSMPVHNNVATFCLHVYAAHISNSPEDYVHDCLSAWISAKAFPRILNYPLVISTVLHIFWGCLVGFPDGFSLRVVVDVGDHGHGLSGLRPIRINYSCHTAVNG